MPSVRRRPPGPGQHPLADLVRSKNPQVTTSTISNENLPLPLDKLRLTRVSRFKTNRMASDLGVHEISYAA
jgi:hypothetical protein